MSFFSRLHFCPVSLSCKEFVWVFGLSPLVNIEPVELSLPKRALPNSFVSSSIRAESRWKEGRGGGGGALRRVSKMPTLFGIAEWTALHASFKYLAAESHFLSLTSQKGDHRETKIRKVKQIFPRVVGNFRRVGEEKLGRRLAGAIVNAGKSTSQVPDCLSELWTLQSSKIRGAVFKRKESCYFNISLKICFS